MLFNCESLRVPGCHYKSYKSIFQRIYIPEENTSSKEYEGTHIFFGSLSITKPVEEQGEEIVFNLFQGKNNNPLTLIVNTRGWKQNSKKSLMKLTRDALRDSKEAYEKNTKNVFPYVFFLGRVRVDESRRVFYYDRHEAFYAKAIENLKLNSSNHGIYSPPPIPSVLVENHVFSIEEEYDEPVIISDENYPVLEAGSKEDNRFAPLENKPLIFNSKNRISNVKSSNKRSKPRNFQERIKYSLGGRLKNLNKLFKHTLKFFKHAFKNLFGK
jgi:hypothetical protein